MCHSAPCASDDAGVQSGPCFIDVAIARGKRRECRFAFCIADRARAWHFAATLAPSAEIRQQLGRRARTFISGGESERILLPSCLHPFPPEIVQRFCLSARATAELPWV